MLSQSQRFSEHWLMPSARVGSLARQSRRRISDVRRAEQTAAAWSEADLLNRSRDLRESGLSNGKLSPAEVVLAAGLVANAVHRIHGFQMHDVQLQAVMAGSRGAIVEMQTGEGKTIVTGAIAAVKAMQTTGVHVGTTNAYLAGRDLEDNLASFNLLGLSASLLPEGNDVKQTQRAYQSDITYGPGYQFGFDYLRDQVDLRNNRQNRLGRQTMNCLSGHDPAKRLRQPQQHLVALIDEADSVMIDEAVTPMVISGPANGAEEPAPFEIANQLALELEIENDYTLKLPKKKIEINEAALTRCHKEIAHRRDLILARPWAAYVENAIRAQRVFQRDVDYVVKDDEVMIVDQHTGRIFDDRTWQDGLHQAVECKERVTINRAPGSVARITRQRYLQKYDQLAGLTGTASGARSEFQRVYGCPVVLIPTNLKCIRQQRKTRFFVDLDAKLQAIADDAIERVGRGQPVLIGTRTIRESIAAADVLTARGLTPTVLNGVQDEEESEIVARAGIAGTLTIATNMAGRGTDIKPDPEAIEAGGLHVIGFSPNGSPRVDRQLVGRAARQGKPGSAQFFVAADDEIVLHHQPSLAKNIDRQATRTGESSHDFSKDLLQMQLRIEKTQFQNRQAMILQDQWLAKVRRSIERD